MKIFFQLILVTCLSISQFAKAGSSISCRLGTSGSYSLFIYEHIHSLFCKSTNSTDYRIDWYAVGPAYQLYEDTSISINCSSEEPSGSYYGVHGEAGIIVKGGGMLLAGKKGQCYLSMYGLPSAGLALNFGKLVISRY